MVLQVHLVQQRHLTQFALGRSGLFQMNGLEVPENSLVLLVFPSAKVLRQLKVSVTLKACQKALTRSFAESCG